MGLKPLAESDLSLILAWRNAPEIRRNMYTTHEITPSEHLQWYMNSQNDPTVLHYIYLQGSIPLGVVNISNYQPERGNAFWGFYASPTAPRGTGVSMEYEAIEYAFKDLELHKLNCEVIVFNEPVIKLHNKVGFVEEGRFRDYHFDGSQYHDVVRLGMLESEWRVHGPALAARIGRLRNKL